MLSPSENLREPARRRLALVFSARLLIVLLIPIFIFRFRAQSFNQILTASGTPASSNDRTVEVKLGSIRKVLLLDGELRAVRSSMIYSNTSEDTKIVYLPPEGTVVKAGDLVVELDSTSVLTKIKDIEERIIAADNEIVKTRSQHESALRDLEIELSKFWLGFEQAKLKARVPNEVVSRREFQEAQLALEKARTEYENHLKKIEEKKKEQAAELQVKTIERDKLTVQLDRARGNLDGMKIKAPSEGMVIYNDHWNERRKIQVGDVVWGGFPIVRLPDLTEMEVLAQVNEVDGPKLSVGNQAEIRLDSYPEKTIGGEIKDISQTAIKAGWMAKAKVFHVTIALNNTSAGIMKPGMSAQISIVIGETQPNLLLPRSSVSFNGNSATVTRVEGPDARREVEVTITASDWKNYQVAGNGALKQGDRILAHSIAGQ
jgi:HlyD family secretion protein